MSGGINYDGIETDYPYEDFNDINPDLGFSKNPFLGTIQVLIGALIGISWMCYDLVSIKIQKIFR